ncbi:uncharacterized protein LOC125067496 [Vanessa atalanta]|uniref:uncharacterized protein LOC125067496 n=1 Tax=Vanessa atalanta TaxID=42275 RepID=UPI001FCDD075|nr:uncharacterized protein LOC125067496 [Vanessa atalanta]
MDTTEAEAAQVVALIREGLNGVCLNNLSYADDMVLLSASVCGIRSLLKKCEEYATQHGLIYNAKKSQYMVFESKSEGRNIEVPIIQLNSVPLERVHTFKYLGHILTPDLKDNMDIERERRALSARANMIFRRFVPKRQPLVQSVVSFVLNQETVRSFFIK